MNQQAGFSDLRLAEANLRVYLSPDAVTEVVAVAVALLVAGTDTPNLRTLAGEDRAYPDEVVAVLDATLRDLGLIPLAWRDAALLVAAGLARRGIADTAGAREVAPLIWGLYASDFDAQWPKAFVQLADAADAVEDLPWWEEGMPWFMESANAFLERDAEGER